MVIGFCLVSCQPVVEDQKTSISNDGTILDPEFELIYIEEFDTGYPGWNEGPGAELKIKESYLNLNVIGSSAFVSIEVPVTRGERYLISAAILEGTTGRLGRMLVGTRPADSDYYKGPYSRDVLHEVIFLSVTSSVFITLQINSGLPSDFFNFDSVKVARLVSPISISGQND